MRSLRSNILRSVLSITGVVFGVASVIAMLSIGVGAESQVSALLSSLGERNIHLVQKDLTWEEWNKVTRATVGLSERDALALESHFPRAQITRIAIWSTSDTSFPVNQAKLQVLGMGSSFADVVGVHIVNGRSFSAFEEHRHAPVALVSEDLISSIVGNTNSPVLGQEIRIGSAYFNVIGVFQAKEPVTTTEVNKEAPSSKDTNMFSLSHSIILPLESATSRVATLPILGSYKRIVLKLPESRDPIVSKQRIENALTNIHRGADVVSVMSSDEVVAQKRQASRLFSVFLLTIAIISLVVGGIGIANVMLASMVERIREVGLRRAIGAKRKHIRWQFLTEALFVCGIGGIVGGVIGAIISVVIGKVTGWKVIFPWWGFGVSLVLSTIVGILAGLYPAQKASKVSPIEALQGRS